MESIAEMKWFNTIQRQSNHLNGKLFAYIFPPRSITKLKSSTRNNKKLYFFLQYECNLVGLQQTMEKCIFRLVIELSRFQSRSRALLHLVSRN